MKIRHLCLTKPIFFFFSKLATFKINGSFTYIAFKAVLKSCDSKRLEEMNEMIVLLQSIVEKYNFNLGPANSISEKSANRVATKCGIFR